MSEDIDYAARVQRGIALLDQKWPAWATEISLSMLDIESGNNCVTAQYAYHHGDAGGWTEGRDMLDIDSRAEYAEHGFNGVETEAGSVPPEAYATLNGLWKAAILERRSQVQDAPAEPEATA